LSSGHLGFRLFVTGANLFLQSARLDLTALTSGGSAQVELVEMYSPGGIQKLVLADMRSEHPIRP